MKSCVITGAAGFIGFHLASVLAHEGYRVTCVDNFLRGALDSQYAGLAAFSNVEIVDSDLTSYEEVNKVNWNVDEIFHLAALNGTQNFYERPFEVLVNSTMPLYQIANQLLATGSRETKLYFASTSEAYASIVSEFSWPVPTDEKVPLGIADIQNTRWSYAASKINGEAVCVALAKEYGFKTRILRFHNVYGPRMGERHFFPDFIDRAIRGNYVLHGAGESRAYLYITDAVRAVLSLRDVETDGDCEIYNIGSEIETTVEEAASIVMGLLGVSEKLNFEPALEGSVQRRIPDIGKLKKTTGWEPIVDLRLGLQLMIDYHKRQ
jgi:nucleoside-diphosphate-sugar epimerase